MKIVLRITLGILALVFVAIAGLSIGLFHTPSGKNFIRSQIVKIGSSDDRVISIGKLGGGLPRQITVSDLSVADIDGVWLTIDNAQIHWKPLSLIGGKFDIDAININGGEFARSPKSTPQPDTKPKFGQVIPNLPNIELGQLQLRDFVYSATSTPIILSGTASAKTHGKFLEAGIALSSNTLSDQMDLKILINPDTNRYMIDGTIASAQDGFLATLSGLTQGLELVAETSDAAGSPVVSLTGKTPDIGDLSIQAREGQDRDTYIIRADFLPSEAIQSPLLTQPVSIATIVDPGRDNLRITITELSSAGGNVSGSLFFENLRKKTKTVNARLNTTFDPEYVEEIISFLGPSADLEATLDFNAETINGSIDVRTENVRISSAHLLINKFESMSAPLVIDLSKNFVRTISNERIDQSATITGNINTVFSDGTNIENLSVQSEGFLALSGDASVGNQWESIDASLQARLIPSLMASLLDKLTFSDDINLKIDATGKLADVDLRVSGQSPSGQLSQTTIPPLTISADLRGFPSKPSGSLNMARTSGAPGGLRAEIERDQASIIHLRSLSYSGAGFEMKANALIDVAKKIMTISSSYDSKNGAEPWPGLKVAGNPNINGTLAYGTNGENDLTFLAPSLSVNDNTISGLDLKIGGTPDSTDIVLSLASLTTSDVNPVRDLTVKANANISDGPEITLNTVTGLLFDQKLTLNKPATVSSPDGLSLSLLNIDYGETGKLQLSGSKSDKSIILDIKFTDVVAPTTTAYFSGDLALDTSNKEPASGHITIRSKPDSAETFINNTFVWDGDHFNLVSAETDSFVDLDLTIPVRLIDPSTLKVETIGALSGTVKSYGDIAKYSSLLPPILESLEGRINSDFVIAGTLSAPDISGSAILSDGRFTELQSGLTLDAINVEISGNNKGGASQLSLNGSAKGAGQERDKTIIVDGDIQLDETLAYSVDLIFDGAEFSAFPVNTVRTTGKITALQKDEKPSIIGSVTIDELDAEIVTPASTGLVNIEVISYSDFQTGSEEDAPQKLTPPIEININVVADDRIFIRGRGLETEWSSNVSIQTFRGEPVVFGKLQVERGYLDFSGRRFDITQGEITFDRLAVNDPLLDIRAEYEAENNLTAALVVNGRAKSPSISLTSTPTLPSEDIMAYILFGKPASGLTPLETAQTAQALASLAGIGPFGGAGGITSKLRETIGLDLLNIDLDPQNGGGSLTVGKYVTDKIFVSGSQNARGGQGTVEIEYSITDNISLETELAQDGDQTISANWKKDF